MSQAEDRFPNPWRTIWTAPRSTFRRLIDTSPTRSVILLAGLGGISNGLDRASAQNLGDAYPLPEILLIILFAGPVGGVIGLYLVSWLLRLVGNWLGGTATSETVRTAVAWSQVPLVASLVLWVLALPVFGSDLFSTNTPRVDANPMLFLEFGLIDIALAIWVLVLTVIGLSEANRFAIWRAVTSILLAMVLVVAAVSLPILLIG
ncbi:Yip1 family protein [Thioalkalivibrio sp. XN8]|uniref:Yip1 family protein n=1 Tax=Thioalkalivibrio sp. XN8 TaxID=2712863 RepID=UPI0013ED4E6A|nr:Yip1 family protein [Thioalkalivibrio sp. XN8]NGP53590.1 YIP1 family protein [Thioalkalivibrio sp. XN8]